MPDAGADTSTDTGSTDASEAESSSTTEKIRAGIDLDQDGETDFRIAGMGPLQTVLVFVILMFLIDVVFNGGAVAGAILDALLGA